MCLQTKKTLLLWNYIYSLIYKNLKKLESEYHNKTVTFIFFVRT